MERKYTIRNIRKYFLVIREKEISIRKLFTCLTKGDELKVSRRQTLKQKKEKYGSKKAYQKRR